MDIRMQGQGSPIFSANSWTENGGIPYLLGQFLDRKWRYFLFCGMVTKVGAFWFPYVVSVNATMAGIKKASSLFLQSGALLASVAQPALAVTGSNNNFDDDLTSMLIQAAIVAVGYFLVMPPIIMNWMRLRWYKRKFFEMYLQFMFVFIFFPGILLWAPFLNFRRLPRDPSMKYPWSTPKDMSMENPSS